MAYTLHEEKGDILVTSDGLKERDVFVDAARGLFSTQYDFEKIRGRDERVKVVVEGKDMNDLLRAWLIELAERQILHSLVYGNFTIVSIQKLSPTQYLLTGSAHGEPYDSAKHPFALKPLDLKKKGILCERREKKYYCEFRVAKSS